MKFIIQKVKTVISLLLSCAWFKASASLCRKGMVSDCTSYCVFQYGDCVSVLWRLAKASHMMAMVYDAEGDLDKKKELVLQGLFIMRGRMYHIMFLIKVLFLNHTLQKINCLLSFYLQLLLFLLRNFVLTELIFTEVWYSSLH